MSAKQLIIYPSAFTPFRNNLQKAEIVEPAPFGEKFIGILVDAEDAVTVWHWIRSEPFYRSQTWLSQPDYHITEEAFNTYVKEIYDRETRSL